MPLPPYDAAKNLAGSLELDYFQRPRRLTRRLKIAAWGTLLACLAGATYFLLPRGQRFVQAGTLSASHALFQDDCTRCHQEPFRTATRLWGGSDIPSVPDSACLVCHPGPNHQESRTGHAAVTAKNCASCHKEHRGRGSLARVPDGQCRQCHADPKQQRTDTTLEAVADFAHHPEFALLRTKSDDAGTIHFNHQVHLHLPREARGIDKPLARLREARCSFCHEPDSAGRYMLPVRYERHCHDCHPLTISVAGEGLTGKAAEAARALALRPALHPGPGQTAAVVRADVRERFLRFAREHALGLSAWSFAGSLVGQLAAPFAPSALASAVVKPSPVTPDSRTLPRRIPGPSRTSTATMEEVGWAGFQLWQAERSLFDGADGCRRCHTEARRSNGLPEYQQPHMKDRWYLASRFDHHSHRMLNCLECHDRAAVSTTSADVMLPGVGTCQRCHTTSGGAKSECVECHILHQRGGPAWQGRLTIDQAIGPHR
jgi:hypothetical protein